MTSQPRILLFGGSGQVGTELRARLGRLAELTVVGRSDADLEDPESVRALVRRIRPQLVVNAAAYTAVDRAESEPDRARLVNALSVGAMADEVARSGGWLVHYSTDYVFDGGKPTGYAEDDPPGPLGVYGATKLEGERLVAASGCRHLILRTSWVFAAHGSNFVRTILRLAAERDELRIVADQVGAPTSAGLIADVTTQCVTRLVAHHPDRPPPPAGLHHLAAGGETSWHGFATLVLDEARRHGLPVRVPPAAVLPIPATHYPTPARRPANSRLDTSRLRTALGIELVHHAKQDYQPITDRHDYRQ